MQDNTAVLQTLVTFLQQNGNRQAILSETGGGNTASCETMCEASMSTFDTFDLTVYFIRLNTELAFVKNNFPTMAGFAV